MAMKRFATWLAIASMSLEPLLAGAQVPAQPAVPPPIAVQPTQPAAPVARPLPPSRWTADQVRQSFELADNDSNGELTRAEAQRLTIMPRSFEDTDQNKDGVIVLGEYEAAFPR